MPESNSMKKIFKRIALVLCALLALSILAFVILVGPWPAYADSKYKDSAYYAKALADIDAGAAKSDYTDTPGALQAGWASRSITPNNAPLSGYGARKGDKMSTGSRDPVEVRVLALSDGKDRVVIAGADMLIIPPNIATLIRERVAAKVQLSPNNILLNASHTHCGPGGFAPGFASKAVGGAYDATIPEFIATGFVDAIVDALGAMEPATISPGSVEAPQYIRNRARDNDDVDAELSFAVLKQADGDTCYLTSYNAHPTIFGAGMMQFSAEYPGELVRHLHRSANADAVYLGGAVGSMGPKPPEAGDAEAKVVAMGQALAQLVLDNSSGLPAQDHVDIASVGIPVGMPGFQMRPFSDRPGWRLSPLFGSLVGARADGWIQGIRVGNLLFVGLPCDFGGEISIVWKKWAAAKGIDLWTLSFNGAYCGYFSPDEHYNDLPLGYETGMMGWYGPNTEAYFTDLFHHVADALKLTGKTAA